MCSISVGHQCASVSDTVLIKFKKLQHETREFLRKIAMFSASDTNQHSPYNCDVCLLFHTVFPYFFILDFNASFVLLCINPLCRLRK